MQAQPGRPEGTTTQEEQYIKLSFPETSFPIHRMQDFNQQKSCQVAL